MYMDYESILRKLINHKTIVYDHASPSLQITLNQIDNFFFKIKKKLANPFFHLVK